MTPVSRNSFAAFAEVFQMMPTKKPLADVATALVRGWCQCAADELRPHLSEDFTYDNGMEALGKDLFLSRVSGSGEC
jgi:hypothetical protein